MADRTYRCIHCSEWCTEKNTCKHSWSRVGVKIAQIGMNKFCYRFHKKKEKKNVMALPQMPEGSLRMFP